MSNGRYRAYPEYKDSGVEWIGAVPKHWKIVRIKETCEVINGFPFDSKRFDPVKGVPLIRIRDINSSRTEIAFDGPVPEGALVTDGDVLVGMDGDFNVAWWRGGKAALNQRVACIRSKSIPLQKLVYHSLPFSMQVVNDLTYFTTVKHLSSFDILKSRLCKPSDEEIQQIAAFLDHETAKIDRLIEKQEELIRLLKEKRQAVISHAVTKGLNPHVPLKDSGIPWLGQIPEHWTVVPLKRLARLTTGITPPTDNQANYAEPGFDEYPWVRPEDLDESGTPTTATKFLSRRGWNYIRPVAEGASLICCIGTIGKVGITDRIVSTNQQITAAEFIASSRFYFFALVAGRVALEITSTGNVIRILNTDRLGNIPFAAPPPDEAEVIAEYIERNLAKFQMLTADAQRTISLLQERRTALISAAVTGKIDVRHWQPPRAPKTTDAS